MTALPFCECADSTECNPASVRCRVYAKASKAALAAELGQCSLERNGLAAALRSIYQLPTQHPDDPDEHRKMALDLLRAQDIAIEALDSLTLSPADRALRSSRPRLGDSPGVEMGGQGGASHSRPEPSPSRYDHLLGPRFWAVVLRVACAIGPRRMKAWAALRLWNAS